MARGTVELTFPIVEKARGAVFYDVGYVNPDAWDFSLQDLSIPRGPNALAGGKTGPRRTYYNLAEDFGVGIRLDLPIGPLRLDYGYPIETAGNGKHGHLNFSVGYQF